jgi:hypothetical protein
VKRFSVVAPLVLLVALMVAPAAARSAEPFAGGCPSKALEEGAVKQLNHDPRARKAIVPAGATSLRICRYYGSGYLGKQTPKTQARAGELQDRAVVNGRDLLESLTLEFKELEAAPKGPISCPADEGAELYAVFSYRDAKPVILDVSLSGCRFVGNGHARARWLSSSLEKRLLRLAEGKPVKPGPEHGEVREKNAVAHPPPHLSFVKARHEAMSLLELFCSESKLCRTQSTGPCTRRTAAAFGCRYTAELLTGEVCRGTFSIKAMRGGSIQETPGVLSTEEGDCFYLFAPPGLKEREEEEED